MEKKTHSKQEREEIPMNREKLAQLLTSILYKQHDLILKGRLKDEKRFKIRTRAAQVFGQIAAVYDKVLEKDEIAEINKRLDILEKNDAGN